MTRGTTPTFIFTLPFDGGSITALNICFVQQGEVILEKQLADCVVSGNVLKVALSEAETLLFETEKGMVEVQLRVGCGTSRLASNILRVCVGRILKDGCLE